MPDAGTELCNALYDRLAADSSLMDLVFDIYDDTRTALEDDAVGAPWGAELGYISFGPESVLESNSDCIEADLITIQIDAWSKRPGKEHCRSICFAISEALKPALELESLAVSQFNRLLFRVFADVEDGVWHGVLQFSARVEQGI